MSDMDREIRKIERNIDKEKEANQTPPKPQLPTLKKKSRQKIMEEQFNKTNYTAPTNVTDYFELENGVTIMQGSKTKTNQEPKEFRFNDTGTRRFNKTDYTQL